jgi:hypothetical protein
VSFALALVEIQPISNAAPSNAFNMFHLRDDLVTDGRPEAILAVPLQRQGISATTARAYAERSSRTIRMSGGQVNRGSEIIRATGAMNEMAAGGRLKEERSVLRRRARRGNGSES